MAGRIGPNFFAFSDELTKIAVAAAAPQRSVLKDFAAGVDPTGTLTFDYGRADPGVSERTSAIRRGVGMVGGTIGGALAIPAGISGVIGAGQAFAKARGGLRSRFAAMPGGLLYGAKKPFSQLYHAGRAGGVLRRAEQEGAEALSKKDVSALSSFGKQMVPTELQALAAHQRAAQVLQKPEAIRSTVQGMTPEQLQAARSAVSGEAVAAGMGLGLSGAIGGGSAYMQYGRGRAVGQQHQRELQQARRGG